MRELVFSVCIQVEPDGDEFHAYCPALKGLHVSGRTEGDALANAKDAAIAYLESLIAHNDPIPLGVISGQPSPQKVHPCQYTEVITLQPA